MNELKSRFPKARSVFKLQTAQKKKKKILNRFQKIDTAVTDFLKSVTAVLSNEFEHF